MSNSSGNWTIFPGPLGMKAMAPPNVYFMDRDPTIYDIPVSNMDIWYNFDGQIIWQCLNMKINPSTLYQEADWALIYPQSGGGGLTIIHADVGDATEDGGEIYMLGGLNINTSNLGVNFPHQLTINLNDSVSITGTFTSVGNIAATNGTITADNGLIATTGGLTVAAGGITSTGVTTLHSLGIGAVQSSAGGVLSSSAGAQGTLLMGTGIASASVWGNLVSGDDSVLINTLTPGSIDLRAVGGGGGGNGENPVVFRYYQNGTVPNVLGNSAAPGYYAYGTGMALTQLVDVGNNVYAGDGAGAAAYFEAPATAKYCFTMGLYSLGSRGGNPSPVTFYISTVSGFQNDTQAANKSVISVEGIPGTTTPASYNSGWNATTILSLTLGDRVYFTANIAKANAANALPCGESSYIEGFLLNSGSVGIGNAKCAYNYGSTTVFASTAGTDYLLGNDFVLTESFDVGANVYPGSGLNDGNPAYFEAPVTGKYYFKFSITLRTTPVAEADVNFRLTIINTTTATNYDWPYSWNQAAGVEYTTQYSSYQVLSLAAGDIINFQWRVSTIPNGGSVRSTNISGFLIQGPNNPSFIDLPNTTQDFGEGYIAFNGLPSMSNFSQSGFPNTFLGTNSGSASAGFTGGANIGIGSLTLNAITTGTTNICIGYNVAPSLTTGVGNTIIGNQPAALLTTGTSNVAIGGSSLGTLTTGSRNVAIGVLASSGINAVGSDNIHIGYSTGIAAGADTNTLRIGNGTGGGAGQINRAIISGIRGIATGVADAIAVLIDSNGQLGTVSSSRRYKENIQHLTLGDEVLKLQPVTFTYKENGTPDFGLIAEEVAQVLPDIVVYKDGEPETVQYHKLPVLLLDALQKQDATIKELQWRIKNLENRAMGS